MTHAHIRTPEPGETVIETDRLLLRRFREDDLEALHSYMSIPEVCRWVPFEPATLEDTRVRIERKLEPWWTEEKRVVNLAAERKDDGRLIGDVIVMSFSDPVHRNSEFGYVFHPDVAGHGYATEAAKASLDWAFATLDLRRVTARVDTENVASWRLLERLGFRREAHLIQNEWFKGRWGDEYDYAVLATEWAALSVTR